VQRPGGGVTVHRVVHVNLDGGDVATIRHELPEMSLTDAVRHIVDVWMDARLGPSPDDAVAMLEDAEDAGADG
jgi:hypothetical protein